MARQLAVTRLELESARRELAKTVASSTDDEVGRTFADLRQVLDHYEAQGFTLQGRFERSQWPAKVVHQRDATNEITLVLKQGGRHRFPGYTGYRLRAVTLEDASGGETVVVLKSKDRVASP